MLKQDAATPLYVQLMEEIEKNIKNDRTVTDIRELTGEESLKEMARLLGSGELTEAVLCNAREMRQTAEKVKESR